MLHDKGNLIPADWNTRLPNNSSPYYSTTAFLRKATRKHPELGRPGKERCQRGIPNPKTSGNGRYTYLAAWMATSDHLDGDKEKVRDYMAHFLANVAVFDSGGRAATVTFAEREIGDVLISLSPK